MKSNLSLLFCAVAAVTLWASFANADDATITLDLNYGSGAGSAGTWQLLGRVDDTGGGVTGEFGLSAVRALLDNIEFGTLGDAITLASGIGALDPLDEGGANERKAALLQTSGTVDLIYGQDLFETGLNVVVPLVGNSGDTLLASGSFLAGSTPAFGQDDTSASTLFTQALFLTNGASPYNAAVDPDNTFTLVTDNLPAGVTGDYNGNGIVDAADYTRWLDSLGSTTDLAADGNGNNVVDAPDYGVWETNFGNTSGTGTGAPVPEPCTLVMAFAMGCLIACRRNRN